MITKIDFDELLNAPGRIRVMLCRSCVSAFYAEEIKRVEDDPHLTSLRTCQSCYEQTLCRHQTFWQKHAFRGKNTGQLVAIFNSQASIDPQWVKTGNTGFGAPILIEMTSRSIRSLDSLYFHFSQKKLPAGLDPEKIQRLNDAWISLLKKIFAQREMPIPEGADLDDWLFMKWVSHESFRNLPVVEE